MAGLAAAWASASWALWRAALTEASNIDLFSCRCEQPANPGDEAEGLFGPIGDERFDAGVLVGTGQRDDGGSASLAVGISRVTGSDYTPGTGSGLFSGGQRESMDPIIGFPIESQLFVNFSRTVGLGLYVFANVNSDRSSEALR
jgi:hypothetical protein